ncbi:cytochrome P450 [Arsenicicoccus sp. oral taxon 190]|uniref:cytochrome P450 n=1 Tax=Arsenicicoccus sp. oral taxon 190 TaxID=1658671 RepID=UPI00067A1C63|nr:cytochrome P450 [Arsenicicoccus sp. oral taxon 190]AKT51606.1 cytochrome P450 [Arsenicicoccus sp. oral taxon 190]
MSTTRQDRTLDFLRRGYGFSDAWRRELRDLDPRSVARIPMRLLGRRALLVRGDEGVRLFYDTSAVKRHGAMPLPIRGPLFGAGAVHGLDDEEHRHRKAMFVGIAYDDAQVARLMPLVEQEWRRTLQQWRRDGGGDVYDAAVVAYGRAIMTWAGVDVPTAEQDRWARRLAQIVDGFGSLSPAHLVAWLNRTRCDRWAASLVRRARSGALRPQPGTALQVISEHRDLRGELLDEHTAAVELQNVIRPTIAVSRFAAFAARALHENPWWTERIARESAERGTLVGGREATAFAEEVRRVYPFVPMLPSIARRDLTWQDQQIQAGDRIFIDIVGTNRDERHWDSPRTFDPRRFLDVDRESIEHFVPQGGGDVRTGHRCPGEKIAVGVLAITVAAMSEPGLQVDPHNLAFDTTRLPTKPHRARVVAD